MPESLPAVVITVVKNFYRFSFNKSPINSGNDNSMIPEVESNDVYDNTLGTSSDAISQCFLIEKV